MLPIAVFGSAATALGDAASELWTARQALNAALAAESRATAEFEKLRHTLSPTELDDYRAFLSRLDQAVRSNCQTVTRLKAQAGDTTAEANCKHGTSAAGLPLSFPGEQTEGERMLELERQLGSSISEFDEMLLREMEQLARTQSGSPDAGAGAGAGTGTNAGDGDSQREMGAKAGSDRAQSEKSSERTADADSETEQTAKVDQAGGSKGTRQKGAVERDDVPDAGDDDVVARQLREAAESETDPELREKLWQEYRRYKSDTAQAQ